MTVALLTLSLWLLIGFIFSLWLVNSKVFYDSVIEGTFLGKFTHKWYRWLENHPGIAEEYVKEMHERAVREASKETDDEVAVVRIVMRILFTVLGPLGVIIFIGLAFCDRIKVFWRKEY